MALYYQHIDPEPAHQDDLGVRRWQVDPPLRSQVRAHTDPIDSPAGIG